MFPINLPNEFVKCANNCLQNSKFFGEWVFPQHLDSFFVFAEFACFFDFLENLFRNVRLQIIPEGLDV